MKFYTFIFYSLGLVTLSLSQTEICSDDDTVISIGLSIWTDINDCTEALEYILTQNLDCFTPLNLPFVSSEPISLSEICCQTCQGEAIYGCTDITACNYDEVSTEDDGSCEYPEEYYDCNNNCLNDIDFDGVCDELEIYGCIDINNCNYNPEATENDSSCGLIDDCGDCQIPYCLFFNNSIQYISETDCDMNFGIWFGNDCLNDFNCLSSSESILWNSGCFSLHENNLQSSDKIKYNLIGQHSGNNYFFQYFKSNGRLIKKIISNE